MKRLILILIAAVLAVSVGASSEAMSRKGSAGRGKGEHCGKMQDRLAALGLDEKQKGAVEAIHLRMKKEMIRKKADMELSQVELREILGKDAVDVTAAEAKVRQLESLRAEMKIMHIKAREEVKALLTPDQKKEFKKMHGMDCMEGRTSGMWDGHGCCMDGDMDCGKHGYKDGKHGKGKCGNCPIGDAKKGSDKDKDSDGDKPGSGAKAGHKH